MAWVPKKIKILKISSGGSGGISEKIYTSENFPLYGNCETFAKLEEEVGFFALAILASLAIIKCKKTTYDASYYYWGEPERAPH